LVSYQHIYDRKGVYRYIQVDLHFGTTINDIIFRLVCGGHKCFLIHREILSSSLEHLVFIIHREILSYSLEHLVFFFEQENLVFIF